MKRSPVRKFRPGLRRGELTPDEKEAERLRVYNRAGGMCELRGEDGQPLDPGHWEGVLPLTGDSPWSHGHLVHLHAKRPAFWSEAQGNTLLWGCPACHLIGMHQHGLKPMVPR